MWKLSVNNTRKCTLQFRLSFVFFSKKTLHFNPCLVDNYSGEWRGTKAVISSLKGTSLLQDRDKKEHDFNFISGFPPFLLMTTPGLSVSTCSNREGVEGPFRNCVQKFY